MTDCATCANASASRWAIRPASARRSSGQRSLRANCPTADYRLLGETEGHSLGQPTPESARAAQAALEEAARLALAREIDAVVTGPIHKARMYEIGFEFPGQTEFFAARCGVENFAMLLTGGGSHRRARHHAHPARRRDRKPADGRDRASRLAPRRIFSSGVAVPGASPSRDLNPHAGESGALGREEIEIIAPAIAELQSASHRDRADSPAHSRPTPFFITRSRENWTPSFACITIRD